MRIHKIAEAETVRYAKIQRLTDLICPKEKNLLDAMIEDGLHNSIDVGSRIEINGQTIRIRKQTYSPAELQKVTISTEGSMAIYDCSGRKLCGSITLNSSTKNVELFCLWVRKYNVHAEVISGARERFFQWFILVVGILLIALYKVLNILNNCG